MNTLIELLELYPTSFFNKDDGHEIKHGIKVNVKIHVKFSWSQSLKSDKHYYYLDIVIGEMRRKTIFPTSK